jgi:hypothetical protein
MLLLPGSRSLSIWIVLSRLDMPFSRGSVEAMRHSSFPDSPILSKRNWAANPWRIIPALAAGCEIALVTIYIAPNCDDIPAIAISR